MSSQESRHHHKNRFSQFSRKKELRFILLPSLNDCLWCKCDEKHADCSWEQMMMFLGVTRTHGWVNSCILPLRIQVSVNVRPKRARALLLTQGGLRGSARISNVRHLTKKTLLELKIISCLCPTSSVLADLGSVEWSNLIGSPTTHPRGSASEPSTWNRIHFCPRSHMRRVYFCGQTWRKQSCAIFACARGDRVYTEEPAA